MLDKKKVKGWMKFYSLGVIIGITFILIVTFTILFADKINNLQETILIITLLSQYIKIRIFITF